MTFLRCGAGLVAVMFAGAGTAWSQTPAAAGRIEISSGQASIVREGKEVPAKAGELVYQADVLKTGADGRLGVTLRDESQISLGPTSEVRVDRFVYAPAEGDVPPGFLIQPLVDATHAAICNDAEHEIPATE